MAIQDYTYQLTDFPNQKASAGSLSLEIEAKQVLTVALADRAISVGTTNAVFWFKSPLGTDDLAALDEIVAAHQGTNPPLDIQSVEIGNIPEVVPRRSQTKVRAYAFSHDWCDKTTWYTQSKKKTDQVIGVGDASKKDFVLEADYPVIEIGRGKITDDHRITDGNGDDYCVHVKVGTASAGYTTLTEREPFEESGGDFWVDYDNPGTDGTMVHLAVAPATGDDVVVTYHYCDTDDPMHSIWRFQPPAGKKWVIDHVEAQFTADVELTDTIIYQAWIDYPGLGWIPVPGEEQLRYHSAHNYDDYVRGSQPEVPAWGGTSKRGRQTAGRVVQWDYDSSIVLKASQLVAVQVWCQHDRAMGGGRVTITIYAMEEDE
jgi:hypothetical protein